ncbi:MAG: polysaccharide deacetylase family protein [Actinomycetota bacterium]
MKRVLIGALLSALALTGCSVSVARGNERLANTDGCKGYVGVTVDDGPTTDTWVLLKTLQEHHDTATFFNVGAKAKAFPDTVRSEASVGQVANHTYSHPFLDQLTDDQVFKELLGTNQIIASLTGTAPVLFRPPFDRVNTSTEGIVHSLGMTTVLWNVDSGDYAGKGIVRSFAALKAGDIILIHDGIERTRTELPEALDQLKAHKLCTGKIVASTTPHFAWHTQKFGDITFNAAVVPTPAKG